jgi:hypothetical protein
MGCSERGQSGGPRWLNDSKHDDTVASKWWRWEKGVDPQGGDPFIAAGGGWQWWRELWSGMVAALNQWAQQSGIGHDLKAVSAGRRHCSDRVADDWGPRGFVFSQNYPNRIKVEN